jgi:hypothetical protein
MCSLFTALPDLGTGSSTPMTGLTLVPGSGPEFPSTVADLNLVLVLHLQISPFSFHAKAVVLRKRDRARSHRIGCGMGQSACAERLPSIRLPAFQLSRFFDLRGLTWRSGVISTLACSLIRECRSKLLLRRGCIPSLISWTRRLNTSPSMISVSLYPSLSALASRITRSVPLMVLSRSATARSRNWLLAHSSISLPYVSRIVRQRDAVCSASNRGRAVFRSDNIARGRIG